MLTASTVEYEALISCEEIRRLSVRRMCSAPCSVEGDHNKEGKQLNFIQHDARLLSLASYLYCTARTRRAQSPSDDLHKGAIADCFEC